MSPDSITLQIAVPADVLAKALVAAAAEAEAKRTKWIPVSKAPAYCGVSKTTFYELVKKWKPPVADIGDRVKVYASGNLDVMMAANQTPGGLAVAWAVTADKVIAMGEKAA